MAAETVVSASLLKYLWLIIVLPIANLFFRQTKIQERVKVLEVKGDTTEDLIRSSTVAVVALTTVVTDLRIQVAKLNDD